jgi:hypothetical protein
MFAKASRIFAVRLILPVVAAVGPHKTHTFGDHARRDEVAHFPVVDRRNLEHGVEGTTERRLDKEMRIHDAGVVDGLVAAVAPASCNRPSSASATKTNVPVQVAGRQIAEDRHVDTMCQSPAGACGVVREASVSINLAERRKRKFLRCLNVVVCQDQSRQRRTTGCARPDHHMAPSLSSTTVFTVPRHLRCHTDWKPWGRACKAAAWSAFEPLRDDVDHAAGRLSKFSLMPRRSSLALPALKSGAVAQRAEDDRIRSSAPYPPFVMFTPSTTYVLETAEPSTTGSLCQRYRRW